MAKRDDNLFFICFFRVVGFFSDEYEGAPGGTTELTDFVGNGEGKIKGTTRKGWIDDVNDNEWCFVGDAKKSRVLFFAHHEDDELTERSFWLPGPQSKPEGMVIIGFGKGKKLERLLNTVPQHFTVGFLHERRFGRIAKGVYNAYKDLVVTTGKVKQR